MGLAIMLLFGGVYLGLWNKEPHKRIAGVILLLIGMIGVAHYS